MVVELLEVLLWLVRQLNAFLFKYRDKLRSISPIIPLL